MHKQGMHETRFQNTALKHDSVQGEVTENQREMIAANWGKLNLSRQGVAHAKQTMIAALNAASEGANLYQLSDRAASTSLAAEKIKAALAVSFCFLCGFGFFSFLLASVEHCCVQPLICMLAHHD